PLPRKAITTSGAHSASIACSNLPALLIPSTTKYVRTTAATVAIAPPVNHSARSGRVEVIGRGTALPSVRCETQFDDTAPGCVVPASERGPPTSQLISARPLPRAPVSGG